MTLSMEPGVTTRPVGMLAAVLLILWAHPAYCTVHGETQHGLSRQSPSYYVDILVLVDYALYSQWLDRSQGNATLSREQVADNDIRRYLTLVISEVTEQYSRLQTNFSRLNMEPVGFHIQTSPSESMPWSRLQTAGGRVNSERTLIELQQWLSTSFRSTDYDHAMLFTGADLFSDNSGHTTGRATVGTLCQGDRSHSVSVIEDRGAFQSVRTAVHELGHSLNASHDGDPGNSCSPSDNFIMASGNMTEQTTANSRNPWLFSPCTAQEIQKYVDSLLNDQSSLQCLQTRLSPDSVPDVTGVIPGQLYNADTQCQHLYGSTSSYCFGGNLSNICTYMPCRDTTDILRQCKVHFAATGTSCGDKQWCEAGACVNSSSAPEIADCLYDTNTLVNGRDCSQAASENPALCYDSDVRGNCCRSCQSIDTGVPGCPYGDRKGGCVREVCQLIEPNGFVYAENCCGTCGFDSSKWTCADAAEVDGLPCADAVRRQGIQGCYNTTLAYLCCATCDRQRDLSRPGGCEYGDLLLRGCSSPSRGGTGCDVTSCCETCRTDGTGTGNSPHSNPIVFVSASIFQVLYVLFYL